MMNKKINIKGFSLVELIIVIAIMAVMIGVLAPQYLKFTTNARVSTDITNANQMNQLINAAVADEQGSSLPSTISGVGGDAVSGVPGLEYLPYCKVDKSFAWEVTIDAGHGVETITLNTLPVYSRTSQVNDYYDQYYVD